MLVNLIAASEAQTSLDLFKLITTGGALGVLAVVFYLMYVGKLVWDRDVVYREKLLHDMTEDRDEWKRMAVEAIQNNQRLARASEKAVGTAEQAVTAATQIASAK